MSFKEQRYVYRKNWKDRFSVHSTSKLVRNRKFCAQAHDKLEKLGIKLDRSSNFSSKSQRQIFLNSLLKKRPQILWCGKGGYGASSLLDQIPWEKLDKKRQDKLIVGFSDISALHSALYAKLGWVGLHAAMPFSKLWTNKKNLANKALEKLIISSIDDLFSVPLVPLAKSKEEG